MIENLIQGFALFANIHSVIAIVGGVLVGIITGAIPGMTGMMGVALALPFTFVMAPVTGILFLLGIYKGAIYGGSISAILVKTPGTPAAACTVLDGWPLNQKGQAGKALSMSLYSSCIADFLSNIALIFIAVPIAMFALRFGAPEYFTLITFSLTIIAGVAGKSLIKGIIAGALGILASTIGMDLVYGTSRFDFGISDLRGGLAFIPVLIGLFAIPELLNEYRNKSATQSRTTALGDLSLTWLEFKRCLKSIFRGSIIAIGIGAIPGIGGAPSAFFSYNEAMRTSPYRENFGKGELEGVAASEAGNNGVCGATLIPLLALGIPGDVITAVLLGAFMIHDLTPGPTLFTENIHFVYALFIGIMLSSLAMLLWGKLLIRLFSKIAKIPNSILFPAVLILCVYGTYAVDNSLFGILVMMIMGIVGYIMYLSEIPPAPFLIGYVLGPLFEDNLRRSLLMSGGDFTIFVRSPITWFFWTITLLTLVFLAKRGITGRRQC